MNKEPVYEIVRSYTRTVQVKQYEPESHFCSVKESFYEMPTEKQKAKKSEELYEFAKSEVTKALGLTPQKEEKKEVKKRAVSCSNCGKWNKAGATKCTTCDSSGQGDRYNMREVEPSEMQGGDGSTG